MVLLVDDEELNLRLMGQLLDKYFKVLTAKSGLDAIKLLNTPNLSVIISDQRMPQMTGVELFEFAVRQAHPASGFCSQVMQMHKTSYRPSIQGIFIDI